MFRRLILAVGVLLATGVLSSQQRADFYREVEPILEKNCLACHQTSFAAGGLQLDSVGGVLKSVVAGDAGKSLLIQRIEDPDRRMPPAASLSHEEIAAIRLWIDQGAKIDPTLNFETQVMPIFRESCWNCHSGENPKAQLRLDSHAGVMKGGIGGVVVLPGNGLGSPMVQWLLRDAQKRMPAAGKPLPADQVSLLVRWIDQGAKP